MATFLRSDGWVKSVLGQAIAGAQIYVCSQPATTNVIPPSPLATIYSDVNGLFPITQPVITDGFGHYDFYIAGIAYTVVVVNGGIIQNSYPDQCPMNVGGGGGGSAITLLTNGTINISQTLLNLVSGSGISMISDASGNVTIINTAGGGGGTSVTLQTNSVPNVVQTLLNLKPGASLSVTPDNFGGVTFALGNIVNNLVFNNDNTNSIGTVGANRPSVVYAGTSVVAPLVNATTGIQINGAAISGNVLRGNGTNFVNAQLGYGDLSGTPQLAVTNAGAAHSFFTSYTSSTGVFTIARPSAADLSDTATSGNVLRGNGTSFVSAQLGYGDLSSLPQLAVTKAAVTSNFLTSYTSTTGVFTAAQPAFTDISGSATTSQLPARNAEIVLVIDGGGSVPSTGTYASVSINTTCTITSATLIADQSGSAVVDVLKSTYAGFPTTSSIAASAKPTLSSAQKETDSTLTGWTKTITAGDVLQVALNSVTTCTRLVLSIGVSIPATS